MTVSSSNYKRVPQTLAPIVKVYLGMELYPENNFDEKAQLPYVTYGLVTPYIRQSFHAGPDSSFSMEVSLAVHGEYEQETLENALVLRSALERFSVKQALAQADVHLERITDFAERPNVLGGEDFEYVVAIDMRLGIKIVGGLANDADYIDSFEVTTDDKTSVINNTEEE
ncbi:MAG: phage neck terminator protein [Weissella confusa]